MLEASGHKLVAFSKKSNISRTNQTHCSYHWGQPASSNSAMTLLLSSSLSSLVLCVFGGFGGWGGGGVFCLVGLFVVSFPPNSLWVIFAFASPIPAGMLPLLLALPVLLAPVCQHSTCNHLEPQGAPTLAGVVAGSHLLSPPCLPAEHHTSQEY